MTIPAISAMTAALPTAVSAPTAPTGAVGAASSATGGGGGFASVLSKGLDAVSSAQGNADNLAIKAATGDLTDVHDYTIAATQASLLTELASTLRTKGVDAINQIMGMQA